MCTCNLFITSPKHSHVKLNGLSTKNWVTMQWKRYGHVNKCVSLACRRFNTFLANQILCIMVYMILRVPVFIRRPRMSSARGFTQGWSSVMPIFDHSVRPKSYVINSVPKKMPILNILYRSCSFFRFLITKSVMSMKKWVVLASN